MGGRTAGDGYQGSAQEDTQPRRAQASRRAAPPTRPVRRPAYGERGSRLRRAIIAATLTGLALSLLFGALFVFVPNGLPGLGATTPKAAPTSQRISIAVAGGSSATASNTPNAIARENALPGTTAWMLPNAQAATIEIQGYASAEYIAPGQTLTFYVSTQRAGDPYSVDVYRIGWYGGAGGRLMSSLRETGQAQGYFDWDHETMIACSSCLSDPMTHLMDANWQPSFSLPISQNWVTGLYVAKLTTPGGKQAYVHFTVTGSPNAAYLVTMPDMTTAAYNDWGGYSLYHGPDQRLATRAFKVSFNRPALGWRFGNGAGFTQVLDAIRWFERNGYDISYTSNVEISEHPEVLNTHRAFISAGHDEYWTLTARNAVQRARDAGIGLAFLGANAAYWNVRLAPDSHGRADRTVVCYKDALLDPLYGKNNADVTVEWRQPPLNRPENALVGVMYAGWTLPPKAWSWRPTADDSLGLMDGTGLKPGASYGCNVVGYEWDRVYNNGASPPALHVLAISPTVAEEGYASESESAYYVASSGAFVFASGSIYFSYALDDLHVWDIVHLPAYDPCLTTNRSAGIPGIQILMAHVMRELLLNHHPLPPRREAGAWIRAL